MRRPISLGCICCTALLMSATAAGQPQRPAEDKPAELTSRQARAISVIVEFIDAFNREDLAAAMNHFSGDRYFSAFVGVSDCDYLRQRREYFPKRAFVRRWLEQRFADDDRLTVATVRLIGGRPLGAVVTYSRRSSKTIEKIGFPAGIRPTIGTKVGFSTRGPVKLTQFANAGSDLSCTPEPARP